MEQKNKKIYPELGRKVIVAMSGGVDSSVAAALLKKQGYEVAGVFMKFWGEARISADSKDTDTDSRGSNNSCCFEGAEAAARAVAAKPKAPFYVFNFAKEFKKEVVDYFLAEQAAGRTPNPCVVCNKKIKFGLMFEKAIRLGADYLATGHYARIKKIKNQKSKIKIANQNSKFIYKLFTARDKNKDQSYFLYQLNQRQLNRVIFPLGDLTKEEVIKLAKKWRLPYRREESFDLCFVGNDTESFIKKYLKLKPGKILSLHGEVLGEHQGLPLYTIGQRKSVPVPQGPWWVVKKDGRKSILFVSNDEKDLYSKTLIASKVNWLSGSAPPLPLKVWAKIRYKSEAAEAKIIQNSKFKIQNLRVIFIKPQRAITPGQSIVFYAKSGEVLGGGVIG